MPVLVMRQGRSPVRLSNALAQRIALAMLRALDLPRAELSLVLTDDANIHELNRTHRHKDRATDVLAFSQNEDARGRFLSFDPRHPVLLGDVVISLDTAQAQARQHGLSVPEEFALLVAHGLLHLLGCDHQNDATERRMKARTQVLAQAGKAVFLGASRSRDRRANLPTIGASSARSGHKTRQNRGAGR